MPAWVQGLLWPVLGLIVAVGIPMWVVGALKLFEKDRVEKIIKEALKEPLEGIKKDISGARRALKDQMDGLGKRVDAATAAAHLAVQNADHALQQIEEIRSIFELQFEHIDEKVPPLQRQLEVWTDIARSIAVNTHAILSDLQNMRGEIDRIKDRLP